MATIGEQSRWCCRNTDRVQCGALQPAGCNTTTLPSNSSSSWQCHARIVLHLRCTLASCPNRSNTTTLPFSSSNTMRELCYTYAVLWPLALIGACRPSSRIEHACRSSWCMPLPPPHHHSHFAVCDKTRVPQHCLLLLSCSAVVPASREGSSTLDAHVSIVRELCCRHLVVLLLPIPL